MTTAPDDAEPRSLSLDALKALAHPLRVQLFSALTSYGPATASALADRLGESSGATSYHLRQLERHGFVREDASRGNGRDRWWERVPGPIELAAPSSVESTAARDASELLEAEFRRGEDQRYADFRRVARSLSAPWQRSVQASTFHLHLTPDELRALGAEFDALVARYRALESDDADRRSVELQLRAFPVIDPSRDRDS